MSTKVFIDGDDDIIEVQNIISAILQASSLESSLVLFSYSHSSASYAVRVKDKILVAPNTMIWLIENPISP